MARIQLADRRIVLLVASLLTPCGCGSNEGNAGDSAPGGDGSGATAGAIAGTGSGGDGTVGGNSGYGGESGDGSNAGSAGAEAGKGTVGESGTGGEGGAVTGGEGGEATSGSSVGGAGNGGGFAFNGLGAYPVASSTLTRGGTITFTNIGASGWWPRRLEREWGDPDCDYKDGTDTWGGHCCMTRHTTTSERLSPFDEEMTFIVKAVSIRQLAVYQPDPGDDGAGNWHLVSSWDERDRVANNLWFTQSGEGGSEFGGDLTGDDCVWYLMQQPVFDCSTADYYCPDDPGINHRGWSGSKLVVMLASMTFDDAGVLACGGGEPGHAGPWVAFVASELIRDGGRKWNGLCNCYSATGSVGDGCGEINVFEVVLDNNEYSNRDFMSTGIRSFQAGHVGGSVCGTGCDWTAFDADAEVVDACSGTAYASGPSVEAGGVSDGCPVWRRPRGDRYFMILLDETRRTIQVAVIHPENVPTDAAVLLPDLPHDLSRTAIDSLVDMRLPN